MSGFCTSVKPLTAGPNTVHQCQRFEQFHIDKRIQVFNMSHNGKEKGKDLGFNPNNMWLIGH